MDPLREAARRDREGPALSAPGGVEWSWGELDRRVDEAALRLAEAGVRMGEAVALLAEPVPSTVVLLHALPRVGALVVPLHARSVEAELDLALGAVGRPRWLLVPDERVDTLRARFAGTGVVPSSEFAPLEGGVVPGVIQPALADGPLETPVAVILTSGSTGRPRPVPLTLGNLMASAEGAAERLRLDPADRWLASLSPAHVGGLALLWRAAFTGSAVVLRPGFDPVELLELAELGAITHASVVPTMLARLLDERGDALAPRGLRCLLTGGAATPAPLLESALARRWPIALTYGLTEASSQVATAPPDQVRRKPGSVGRPLRGVELRIHAPDEEGIGEILVRGATVAPLAPIATPAPLPTPREAPGVPGSPEAAAEPASSPPAPSVHIDPSGWLHTGDLGRIDDEGDLRVTGRASERIVSGGVTLEPAEVERVLLEHPAVAEAAAAGIPDPGWGEVVGVAVTPSDPSAPPTPDELLAHARERLSRGRRPRRVLVLEALPRNRNGKVVRAEVARLLADAADP